MEVEAMWLVDALVAWLFGLGAIAIFYLVSWLRRCGRYLLGWFIFLVIYNFFRSDLGRDYQS